MNIRWFRELFSFSAKERNGIIGLLFIIFILLVIGKLIPRLIPSDKTDFSGWDAEVKAYLDRNKTEMPGEITLHPEAFNPNEVDSVYLINIGLPPRVAANWIKYLRKGGRFRDKEGVKKIFGMTPALFDRLDSFLVFPVPKTTAANDLPDIRKDKSSFTKAPDSLSRLYTEKKAAQVGVQELNSTDSLHLLDIPGIGPVFASRIIRYRNLLGGYHSVSQIKEVYGMREENYLVVSKYFTVDSLALKTININFSTLQELGRHPYIGYGAARKICKLRDKAGKFSSPENLSPVVTGDSLKKLIPYMRFVR